MRPLLKYILAGLLFTSLTACTCGKETNSTEPQSTLDPIKEYADQLFESDYEIQYNETSKYAIISKAYKNKPSDPLPTIRFEILHIEPKEVIFKDAVPGGKVNWVEDYIVEVESYRVIPGPDDNNPGPKKYRYHVKNRKKYAGGFFGQKN